MEARRNIHSWVFHSVIRLMALVVMVISILAIVSTRYDGPSSGDIEYSPVAEASAEPVRITLSEIRAKQEMPPEDFEPAAGEDFVQDDVWPVEENSLSIDAVLVPARETVISSSHDGRISDIPLQNGDRFKKNDVLVRYDCSDLEAEAEMAGVEKKLTDTKIKSSEQLFKLDILSDVDRLNIQTEGKQADSKVRMYEARLNDCTIKAGFNGHVTKRLANEGEYTRTDRVLMEVVSDEPLHLEFLLPSKWLRWVDIGAPVDLVLNETERHYSGKVIRIYGAVDPVSQSIQVRAALDRYDDLLLPGMSGKVSLDVSGIRAAGVSGYLKRRSRP